jgi:phosphohistidine phosphatase
MLLYLLRHAEAEPHCADDFSRRLTEPGYKQARKIGCFMKEQCLRPELILTSPVVRARKTAEIVAKLLGKVEISEVPWAACGMTPERAIDELGAYGKFKNILLVGHEPDFSQLIANLVQLTGSPSIEVTKASLSCISLNRIQSGSGTLQFLLPVRFL